MRIDLGCEHNCCIQNSRFKTFTGLLPSATQPPKTMIKARIHDLQGSRWANVSGPDVLLKHRERTMGGRSLVVTVCGALGLVTVFDQPVVLRQSL